MLDEEDETYEGIRESLVLNSNGQVVQCIDNCVTVLSRDPLLKGLICKNEMAGKIEMGKSLVWNNKEGFLEDIHVSFLLWYFEKAYGISNDKKIREAIKIVAEMNKYHPIKRFLENLEWDHVSRIDILLFKYLGVPISPYSSEVMHLLLEAMIHRLYVPGAKFDLMVCLVGGQGAGKSSFWRILCVEDKWFSDDIKRFDDEKVYQKLQGHWVIEISEMQATVNAKSIEEIKSFLSKTTDNYRVPYQQHSVDWQRQCVFVGTTNNKQFLLWIKPAKNSLMKLMKKH